MHAALDPVVKRKLRDLYVVEVIVVIVFTIDYIVRFVLTRENRVRFVLNGLNLIDLLSIVPFYIDLIMAAANANADAVSVLVVLRVLRLFRVFRILKVAKYSKLLGVVAITLVRSVNGLLLGLFTVSLALIVYSSLIYYAETGYAEFVPEENAWYQKYRCVAMQTGGSGVVTDCDVCKFQSVPETFYWCLITITTVGCTLMRRLLLCDDVVYVLIIVVSFVFVFIAYHTYSSLTPHGFRRR